MNKERRRLRWHITPHTEQQRCGCKGVCEHVLLQNNADFRRRSSQKVKDFVWRCVHLETFIFSLKQKKRQEEFIHNHLITASVYESQCIFYMNSCNVAAQMAHLFYLKRQHGTKWQCDHKAALGSVSSITEKQTQPVFSRNWALKSAVMAHCDFVMSQLNNQSLSSNGTEMVSGPKGYIFMDQLVQKHRKCV